MTWTLILRSTLTAKPDTVLSGYVSQAEANAAGRYAMEQVPHAAQGLAMADDPGPVFGRFVVIPGPSLVDPLVFTSPAAPLALDGGRLIDRLCP